MCCAFLIYIQIQGAHLQCFFFVNYENKCINLKTKQIKNVVLVYRRTNTVFCTLDATTSRSQPHVCAKKCKKEMCLNTQVFCECTQCLSVSMDRQTLLFSAGWCLGGQGGVCVCVCMCVMASTGHTDVGMCDKNSITERLRDDDRFSSCPLLDILNIIDIKAELFRLVQCQHTVIWSAKQETRNDILFFKLVKLFSLCSSSSKIWILFLFAERLLKSAICSLINNLAATLTLLW